jgi:hypothetical protein
VNDDVKVRRAIAEQHGLDWPAAKLLVGETVPELEASASRLAALLHERDEQHERVERQRSPSGLFEVARAQQAERCERLVNALCGRTQQRRDQAGRFSGAADDDHPAAAFDGGARTAVQRPVTHESWLSDALRTGVTDVGADL